MTPFNCNRLSAEKQYHSTSTVQYYLGRIIGFTKSLSITLVRIVEAITEHSTSQLV